MRTLVLFLLINGTLFSQSFAPEPGALGSTAIHADSNVIESWATSVSVSRGYLDIAVPGLGFATFGISQDALGAADGNSVVSLGDGGVAVIQLESPVYDGPGPDFAIFENGFIDHYMEFAFVEVSTNGIDFVRFEATSEIPLDLQIDNFSTSDCRMVNNLAGKYRQLYGTPFDLNELSGNLLIDVNNINYIRLIDVVGSIDPIYGTTDSFGQLINDPYPTPFESGGFDLDAIGIIHQQAVSLDEINLDLLLYPNPFNEELTLQLNGYHMFEIIDSKGTKLKSGVFNDKVILNTLDLPQGVYFVVLDRLTPLKIVK